MAVVRLQWQDHRLNLTHFTKHSYLTFPPFLEDAIWKPSLAFLDTMDVRLLTPSIPATLTKVTSDGYVLHFRRYMFVVSCMSDMYRYPLNSQRCPFRITTQGETARQVNLRWLSVHQHNSSTIHLHQHSIDIGISYKLKEEVLTTIAGSHRVLSVVFFFPRCAFSSILTLWLPGALSVAFAWAGAWFKGAGVLLPSAALLCVGVHAIQLKTMLKGEELLTSLDIWIVICQVFIVSAFFHYAIACSARSPILEKKRLEDENSGSCERYYTAHGYALMVESSTQTPVITSAAEVEHDYYDRIARYAFGPIFIVVIVIYWAYYLYFSKW